MGLTQQDLPKSNHRQEGSISHPGSDARSGAATTDPAIAAFDCRSIPPTAREAVWRAPDGHAIRRLDWTPPAAPARGAMLFLPGRGDVYEKYLESFEHWRRRGWRVTAADWRGQGGSGRIGGDPFIGHVADFGEWLGDLAAFWREWAAASAPGPLVLVGHSMGGHLVLRAAAEGLLNPQPAALVLSTPMLDVLPDRIPLAIRRAVARLMVAAGDPRRQAWKWSERPGEVPPGRQELLTHDARRYADELWWRERRPELAMGPGSWGWVAAALRSTWLLERPGRLEGMRIPTLLLGTSADRLVGWRAILRAAARLPHGELLRFGVEARHEILRESDPVRNRALDGIDAFLDRACPR